MLRKGVVGVLKELGQLERRVSLTPSNVTAIVKLGLDVRVEANAGVKSGYKDRDYAAAGASVVERAQIWEDSTMVVGFACPADEEVSRLDGRTLLIAQPVHSVASVVEAQGGTAFSLSQLQRTLSAGQSVDVLSSQANLAGYRAVMEASHLWERPFAGWTTSAGRLPPTKVLVLGAGVAGLSSIQTAKNMGAVVTAFDVRSAAAEQVESMGAKFLYVNADEDCAGGGGYAKEMSSVWFDKMREVLGDEVEKTDIVITTALIPGKTAPILITKTMVERMKAGSITVDLAAEAGGNVETTVADEMVVTPNQVVCVGATDLPSKMATSASTLLGNNVTNFIKQLTKGDLENPVLRSTCVVHEGVRLEPYAPPPPPAEPVCAFSGAPLSKYHIGSDSVRDVETVELFYE